MNKLKTAVLGCLFVLALGIFTACGSKYTAEQETTVSLDSAFKMGSMEITFDKVEILDEVKPNVTIGYYNYYEKHEGYHYIVAQGIVENKSSSVQDISAVQAVAYKGSAEYEAKLVFSTPGDADLVKEIPAEMKVRCYLIVLCKSDVSSVEKVSLYFNRNMAEPKKQGHYENKVTLRLGNY